MKPILSHTNSLLLCGCHQKAQCHLYHLGRPELRDDPRQSPKGYVDRYPLDRIKIPENFLPKYPQREEIGAGKGLRDEKLAPFPRDEHAVKVNRQEYYAIITHMDAQIGRILDALEKSGKADNTWIFFTSDLADANREGIEFQSVLPLLAGEKGGLDAVYAAYMDTQRAVIHDGWKLILYPQAKIAKLFNLTEDPQETKDLAADPALAGRKKTLFAQFLKLQKRYNDKLVLDEFFSELK